LAQQFDNMDFVVPAKIDECIATHAAAKRKPLVSVIVPTRNRAHSLPRALDSIYGQEELGRLFDLEVIVVDDASTDTTPGVKDLYRNAKYIQLPERRGVSGAMNEGLRSSQGRYIGFLADDDEFLPHKLRIQVPLLESRSDVGVVYGQTRMRFGGKETLYPDENRAPSGRVFLPMLMDNFCGHHASFLARRSAFDTAGCFDESLPSYEDWDMSLRLAFHVAFLFVPGAVDIYNSSTDGLWLTRAASGAGAEDAARVIEKALRMLPDSARYSEMKQQCRARVALETATRIVNLNQAWSRVLAALRNYPQFLGYEWARWAIYDVLEKSLQAAPTVSAVLAICSQFKKATRDSSEADRRRVQETVEPIWKKIVHDPQSRNLDALRAAVCLLPDASSPERKKLLRIIVRAGLGRRAKRK
jgi:glycosyltransferase involved in cell wall biosynthesis